ncbi:hypothetical protein [Bartonella acomydis]|uniref:Uncharacterized protein n=1 Tax=Bartonella acomydis TaxID=686234 RepID=A0ABP9MG56_9HYPH
MPKINIKNPKTTAIMQNKTEKNRPFLTISKQTKREIQLSAIALNKRVTETSTAPTPKI